MTESNPSSIDGMIFAPPVIDLVWKIDGIGDWSDGPYSWNLLPASHRVLPEETNDQQRALLNVEVSR